MKIRQNQRLVWLSTLLWASSIIAVGTHPGYGQRLGKRSYQQAQFNQSMPSVDVPPAEVEGELAPLMQDFRPPSANEGSGTRLVPESVQRLPESPLSAEPFREDTFGQPSVIEGEPTPAAYPMDQPFGFDDGYEMESPAPIYSTGTWFRRGHWYTDLEVMYLTRTDPRNLGIVPPLPGSGRPQYTLEDLLKLNFTPGARVTLGRLLGRDAANRDHMVEIEYMGGFEWDDHRILRSDAPEGNGGLSTLLNGTNFSDLWGPFISSDVQTFSWDTNFNQVQLNYLLSSRPGRDQLAMQPDGRWVRHGAASQMNTLYGGLRYARLNDRFQNTAILQDVTQSQTITSGVDGSMTTNQTLQDDAINGLYRVLTYNDLFGLNFGAEMEEKYDEWSWGVRGGVAGLANYAQRRSRIDSRVPGQDDTTTSESVRRTDDNGDDLFLDADGNVTAEPTDPDGMANVPLFDQVDTTIFDFDVVTLGQQLSDETFTFVIDLGLFATYQLRPNLHFKVEYNLSYMSGLAFATENLVFSNGFPDLNLNGSTLFHGGACGFEATW